jgi:hypothetical protein
MDTTHVGKKRWYFRWWAIILYTLIFFGVIGSLGTSNNTSTQNITGTQPQASNGPVATSTLLSKEDAQKELDDVIAIAKKAHLVTSYEFSDRASAVYVTDVWYTQNVQFKKDFMAKIAMLKKVITGYNHFEVRHANSNEKVGEVTSFSNSLEVYK